ncbi:hypothetical protein [Mycolicibacter senuensis]|uniref:Uncharacterized protein n=1 Tax=Mycolicibacter senuensis TaxID=386913 RepID=A0A7I9XLP5_9MYCO|nr:hypothetical protein [Mycolicibacter senuensis]GFG70902.1 hypothetical protein MSEN_26220 [Mycolicibacter senuensis]
MRRTRVTVGLIGAAVGAAVAVAGHAGHAGADAIEDAWPYGIGIGEMEAPGFWDPRGGTDGVFTVYDGSGGPDWYTAQISSFGIPLLYHNEHIEVLSVLDDSAGYPSVGTVFDTTEMFPFSLPIGGMMHMFSSTVINDPEAGFASQFTFTPLFYNTFLFTEDGMKDIVSMPGLQFTLFEIPFTDASGGADASDIGDVFAPLLAELAAAGA